MKSVIVTTHMPREEQKKYTDIQVLQSAAGFYLGTLYEERDDKGNLICQEPGSRDSGYYPTRAAAEADLEAVNAGQTWLLRDHL